MNGIYLLDDGLMEKVAHVSLDLCAIAVHAITRDSSNESLKGLFCRSNPDFRLR